MREGVLELSQRGVQVGLFLALLAGKDQHRGGKLGLVGCYFTPRPAHLPTPGLHHVSHMVKLEACNSRGYMRLQGWWVGGGGGRVPGGGVHLGT